MKGQHNPEHFINSEIFFLMFITPWLPQKSIFFPGCIFKQKQIYLYLVNFFKRDLIIQACTFCKPTHRFFDLFNSHYLKYFITKYFKPVYTENSTHRFFDLFSHSLKYFTTKYFKPVYTENPPIGSSHFL